MKNSVLLLVSLFLIFSINVYSQVTQQWVQRYNAPANNLDAASSLAVDTSGNVYVTGWITVVSGSNYDYVTIKYNSSGSLQWIRTYNGPANSHDFANALVIDNSGNVYVTGYSYASAGSNPDYLTIKYNNAGTVQWTMRYNGPANLNDVPNSIAVDINGNVYIGGSSYGGNGPYYDYCIVKYSSLGVQQWVAIYNGPGNADDNAWKMKIDNSSNIYITGSSMGSTSFQDFCSIKYNSSGTQIWVARYNGPLNQTDRALDLDIDTSGNVYVIGSSIIGNNYSTQDYVTLKYSSSGVQQWAVVYNGPGNDADQGRSIVVDFSGNVYVTGSSTGIGTGYDYGTIKYNFSGIQQWVSRYNGPYGTGPDYNNTLSIDLSGNLYVTGGSWATSNNEDYCTVKYNNLGIQQWVQRYNGPGNGQDAPRSIFIDQGYNVYITGSSNGSGTNADFCTIKYSQLVGIQPISIEIPNKFSLSQNYPNPFNPSTKIRFDISGASVAQTFGTTGFSVLSVYDILGREVATLVNEQLKPGTYEVEFDGSNLPSGVYYCKLTTGDFNQSRKMILIK